MVVSAFSHFMCEHVVIYRCPQNPAKNIKHITFFALMTKRMGSVTKCCCPTASSGHGYQSPCETKEAGAQVPHVKSTLFSCDCLPSQFRNTLAARAVNCLASKGTRAWIIRKPQVIVVTSLWFQPQKTETGPPQSETTSSRKCWA